MADMQLTGMSELMSRLYDLGQSGVKAQNKAVKAGGKVYKEGFSREAPRSAVPRLATPKQSWRTGKHGADNANVSTVKTKAGVKYVNVGWLKSDNSPFFYMKFQNWGTSKMPHPPKKGFVEKVVMAKEKEALHEMRNVLQQELRL
ncbi:HK97 gp10 family phage protein [Bacillus cereus VD133]|uniref:HK97 gp10 family phage protein n=1 Tax=Bacillus cereus VD133 TaxID=1053233 RepID=A0A9W5UZY2_BACCE|nr:HK97-gp10 family putative phage morphogenesis protein [Bacillus cereus]EOO28618.1 HK97 gp10 family phage protein [Bacillus cereus VD133]